MAAPESQDTRSSQYVVSNEFSRPCLAIVRNHLDSTYMGGLEVELLTTGSGNSTNAPGQLIPVKYLSPFYGLTSYDGANKNDGHQNSQRSYGFWGIPPDIGAKVLVIFIEGGEGYWIGCVPEENTNFMIPDQMASTTFNSQDNTKKLPVVEYNKKTEKGTGRDSTQYIKPVNADALTILTTQGLNEDEVRGITTSSARREAPSAVFGISSPGPQDKRPGAPRVNYGENFSQTPVPQNRLGGTSIVMDDGDATLIRKTSASEGPPVYVNVEKGEKGGEVTIPNNELFRIRTRTGHQILLHNSEDLIYIGNSKGTTWIELTSDGKIDIFANDSISVHTKADINFKADRDINFEAGRNFNVKANNNVNLESVKDWQIVVGGNNKITTTGNFDLKTTGSNKYTAGGTTDIKSGGNHTETAAQIHMNGPAAATAATASPLALHKLPGEAKEVIMKRVPQHEPWQHHEHLDPVSFKIDKLDRDASGATVAATTTPTVDTFKKSVQRPASSVPAATPPSAGTQSEGDAGEAEARAAAAGVTKAPTSAATVPATVATAANAVKENMSGANVSNLVSAVKDVGSKLTFAVSQGITSTIDSIASSSTLKSISSVGGSAISSLTQGATNLLNLRTTVAKGQLPITIPAGSTDTTNTGVEDREQIASIGRGEVPAGSSVTLSDGNTYTVSQDDDTGDWSVG